jgi:biotin-dependent carboxylase-like uncharacterized protein
MSWIHILSPGLLTTVQDCGRWGFQNNGVSVAGPMDEYAYRLANILVGNNKNAAGLEVTLVGPEIEFEDEIVFAVTGAEFDLALNDSSVPMNVTCRADRGSRLEFGERRSGARAYLAVGGGVDVPVVLGSRSTHLLSGMGGLNGRQLKAGDRLHLAEFMPATIDMRRCKNEVISVPKGGGRVRVSWGPHADRFDPCSKLTLQEGRYTITVDSNRMGYRLDGPSLTHTDGADLISEATPIGALQVPASGQPILLMADRQTTGGYPIIGTVIAADLPIVGQLLPGDWLEFEECDLQEAVGALIVRERSLLSLVSDP